MGNGNQTYEVRVVVKKKGSMHYSSHVGVFIENSITKMFHIDARTQEQAAHKATKYGRLLSCHKVDRDKLVEASLLRIEAHGANNPYPDAIAMDEMVWRNKNKRGERIENRRRDKAGY